MPEISIIVPVYKVEKYLDRCIASILEQTFTDFELILVDDGSPDKCGEICDKWAEKDLRIRVIHKENGGLSSARNAGLDICSGHFINFVDSDDWIPKDSLQYLFDLREKYKADFSIASNIRTHGWIDLIQEDYMEAELTQHDFLTKFFKLGTQENVQYAWAKLYKRELFDEVRYPIGLIDEDVPVTFQIALQSEKIAYSTKIVYFYFYNQNSITDAEFNHKKFDLIKVWNIVCTEAGKCGDRWILNGALMNRKRADFGLLMDLALSDISWLEKTKYYLMLKQNISDLRKNAFELCKIQIPFSRKVFIVAFSVNYLVCVFIIHFSIKIIYKMKKRANQ